MPSYARDEEAHRTRSSISADPLTGAAQIVVIPVFYLVLFIVHLVYYVYLKTISSIRWQRLIFQEIKDRPQLLWQGWLDGLGVKTAGLRTAQQVSEERLLERGNVVRTKGRILLTRSKSEMLKISKKQRPIAPRHLALCLARPPVPTRNLMFRAIGALFCRKRNIDPSQHRKSRTAKSEEPDTIGVGYAIESVKTCLRCAALLGVEEVTIYDEEGLIKKMMDNKSEWFLDLPVNDSSRWKSNVGSETSIHPLYDDNNAEAVSSMEADLPSIPYTGIESEDGTISPIKVTSSAKSLRLKASLQRPRFGSRISSHINGCHKVAQGYHCSLRVNLLGPEDTKGAIAKAATSILHDRDKAKVVDVKAIDQSLRAHNYPNEPDLLIIHGGSRGVCSSHGFPPWLIRLCEIFQDVNASPCHPITAVSIEAAVVTFSQSEQRYGK